MDLIQELRQRKTYLGTAEVISLLNIGKRDTLCGWVRRGRINAIRTGNAYIFDPHQLADWLTERTKRVGRGKV
jgi:excisionase family DNA binding protein